MAILTMITAFLTLTCLFSGWPDASAQGACKVNISTLRKSLQSAIELEWATIPPYLTAALSIKDGTNKNVSDMLWGIMGNEMDHMALAANMLNTIDGEPVLNHPDKAPKYPGPLPAGCLPDLNVTLEKMSKDHTRRVFMGIETPECDESVLGFHGHLSRAASPEASNAYEMSLKVEDAFPGLLAKCDEVDYIPNTIGAIYIHKILCPMLKLEEDAIGRGQTIFTGDPDRQLSIPPSTTVFKVSNLTAAIKAIAMIVSQGEGGDPCNPYVDDQFTEKENEPSHYFKFAEVVHGMEVTYGGNPSEQYFSPCDDNNCGKEIRFNGPQVPFNENDVWPILPNPSTGLYPPGSEARSLSDAFNQVYVDVIQCLNDAMNGQPDILYPECAKNKMIALKEIGLKLVKTPIAPGGDPNVGPNVSPTYEFYYGAPEEQYQQQQRIEL